FYYVNSYGLNDINDGDSAAGAGCPCRESHINNGHGWTRDDSWDVPVNLTTNGSDNGYRIVDVNGDGLLDIVRSAYSNNYESYINNGHGWSADDPSWHIPVILRDNNSQETGYYI